MQVPPTSSARSLIDTRPTPAGRPSASPCPSSLTRTRRSPSSRAQADRAGPGAAVAHRVGDRLERDPVRRHLDRRRQRLDVVARPRPSRRRRPRRRASSCWAARCRRAETRPSWSSAAGRRPSTRRRTSAISSRARSARPPTSRGGLRRVGRDQLLGGLQPHGQGGQRRAEAVVEVAAQAAALLLAGGDDLLPRALELAVGQHGLDQRRRPGPRRPRAGAVAAAGTGRGPAPPRGAATRGGCRRPPGRRSRGGPPCRLARRRRGGAPPVAAGTRCAAYASRSRRDEQGQRLGQRLGGRGGGVEPAQLGDHGAAAGRGRRTPGGGSRAAAPPPRAAPAAPPRRRRGSRRRGRRSRGPPCRRPRRRRCRPGAATAPCTTRAADDGLDVVEAVADQRDHDAREHGRGDQQEQHVPRQDRVRRRPAPGARRAAAGRRRPRPGRAARAEPRAGPRGSGRGWSSGPGRPARPAAPPRRATGAGIDSRAWVCSGPASVRARVTPTQTAYPANGARIGERAPPRAARAASPRGARRVHGGQQRAGRARGCTRSRRRRGARAPGRPRGRPRRGPSGADVRAGGQQRRGAEERRVAIARGCSAERHAPGQHRQQRDHHDRDVLAQRFRGRVVDQRHRDVLVAGQPLAGAADAVADLVADGQVGGPLAGQQVGHRDPVDGLDLVADLERGVAVGRPGRPAERPSARPTSSGERHTTEPSDGPAERATTTHATGSAQAASDQQQAGRARHRALIVHPAGTRGEGAVSPARPRARVPVAWEAPSRRSTGR